MSTNINIPLIQAHLDIAGDLMWAFYESAEEMLSANHYSAVFDLICGTFGVVYALDAPVPEGKSMTVDQLSTYYLLSQGLAGSEHHSAHLNNIAKAAVLNERLSTALKEISNWIRTKSGSTAASRDPRLGYVDFVLYAMQNFHCESV